jgi:glutaredoxin
MQKTVIVYSAQWCCDCQELHSFLKRHKIPCEVRDIQKNPAFRKDLMENAGEIAVPFVVLDGKWIRGYPDGEGYSEAYAKNLFGIS